MALSGQIPDEAALREAALAHLALYPTSAAGLERVLLRRVARAARAAQGEPEVIAVEVALAQAAAHAVVGRLLATGVLDDAAFAAARARRLAREGKSRRAIVAHLVVRGVEREALRAALSTDPAAELLACVVFMRRRRIGPFRPAALADAAARRRELAACARAGFPAPIACQALALSRFDAEERLSAEHRLIP